MVTEQTKQFNFWPVFIIFILLGLIFSSNRYISEQIEEVGQPAIKSSRSIATPATSQRAVDSFESKQKSSEYSDDENYKDDFPLAIKKKDRMAEKNDTRVIHEMPLAEVALPQ